MCRIDENGFLEGRIQDWIGNHRDRHAVLFEVIRELNRHCHRFLDGRAVDATSELKITTSVLFARMMELFQGMFMTIECGMMAVGRILLRAHLEAFFNLMAINRDPTFLKQYLDQLHVNRKKLVNRVRNSSAPSLATLQNALGKDLALEIDETCKERRIRRLTTEDAARNACLHGAYVTAFAILSGAVHTTAWDLESHLDYDDEKQMIRKLVYGPSDCETEKLLALAGMTMADALETISSIFGENRVRLCTRIKAQFQALLDKNLP